MSLRWGGGLAVGLTVIVGVLLGVRVAVGSWVAVGVAVSVGVGGSGSRRDSLQMPPAVVAKRCHVWPRERANSCTCKLRMPAPKGTHVAPPSAERRTPLPQVPA